MRATANRPRPGVAVLLVGVALAGAPASAEVIVQRLADGTLKLVATGDPRPEGTAAVPRPSRPMSRLEGLIERYARSQALDPQLVRAVVQAESGFDPQARSTKGAMGLMQLMPETARELGVSDPWDPEQNIRGGTRYLRQMLKRFGGDLEKALAGYNAGPSAVERHGGVPPFPETTRYIGKVLALYRGGKGGAGQASEATPGRSYRPFVVTRSKDGTVLLATRD